MTRETPSRRAELAPIRTWRHWLATLGGAGWLPLVPGTWGSLVALLPLFLIPGPAYPWAVASGAIAAIAATPPLARRLGIDGHDDGGDPGWFVLDEAAGLWIAAFALDRPPPLQLGLAFLLFRAFDMLKPPPLRRLELVGSGWGVLLDDVGAGMYALALTMILGRILLS